MPRPGSEEREAAKEWVEAKSCNGGRGGWIMVDGTLIPLYTKPSEYGNCYYDRKSNYSINVQV
jgi:hypothetical protein